MPFNSYFFIFIFLPVTFCGYFVVNKFQNPKMAKLWMICASLYFYSFFQIKNLPLLCLSILTNFRITSLFHSNIGNLSKKWLLRFGLFFNLILLGFFKYGDFAIGNFNWLFKANFDFLQLALPLGISFFTLQQIAFLIDTYEGLNNKKSFLDYTFFVTFFPQLISGPIVKYAQLMPSLEKESNRRINLQNVTLGIFLFCIGLVKKVILSNTFSTWASPGFDESLSLDFLAAWKTSLSYTFQLYFDFSGYTDMAIGIGYLFNFKLPQNFNSPLKSKSVIEFWTRWHMTLSQFITTYVFTPIVRSMPKINFQTTMIATVMAMFISGIWHGAGWTFILYGIFHGLALVINHVWKKKKRKLPPVLSWFMTFNFINITMVFFRAKDLDDALKVLRGMFGFDGFIIPKIGFKSVGFLKDFGFKIGPYLYPVDYLMILFFILSFFLIHQTKNSLQLEKEIKINGKMGVLCGIAFVLSLFGMNKITEFIYFNF